MAHNGNNHNISVRTPNVTYSKLPLQDVTSDSEEEVLFSQANRTLGNNNDTDKYAKQNSRRERDIKLMLAYRNLVKFHKKHVARRLPTTTFCICMILLAVITVTTIILAIVFNHHGESTSLNVVGKNDKDWNVLMEDYASESCVRLVDVNGDGAQDVIIAVAKSKVPRNVFTEDHMDYNCYLIAMDGRTGAEIWRVPTQNLAFVMNCADIDVNQDGTPDCIITGRKGVLQAVDPIAGNTLWVSNSPSIERGFNTYHIIATQDLDNDGVNDMIVPNGGNQSAKESELHRAPGRLILMSGKTGQAIGDYLDMPNSRETYMSPVMFRANDHTDYVLFGSGGEKISGAFLAISLKDLYDHATKSNPPQHPPKFSGTNNIWTHHKDTNTNIITIFQAKTKGVMVPPLIADFTNDAKDDILLLTYEGDVILFDSVTLDIIWRVSYNDCETYTSPAPGYFNDDSYLDIMIHQNQGVWPDYKSSLSLILSGKDGSELWSVRTPKDEMSCELSLRTMTQQNDVFVFTMRGLSVGNHSGDAHHDVHKRHEGHPHKQPCQQDISIEDTHIFMMDRTTAQRPQLLGSFKAQRYHYKITEANKKEIVKSYKARGEQADVDDFSPGPFCAVMSGTDRNAPAIGDLDGDGTLSWVRVHWEVAQIVDWRDSYVKPVIQTHILKINLNASVQNASYVSLEKMGTQVTLSLNITGAQVRNRVNRQSDLKFLPYAKQEWTEYLGKSTGHYKANV